MENSNIVDRIVSLCGDRDALAAARFGVSKQAIAYWRRKGYVPAGERCYQVSEALHIPLHQLNPKFYREGSQ